MIKTTPITKRIGVIPEKTKRDITDKPKKIPKSNLVSKFLDSNFNL